MLLNIIHLLKIENKIIIVYVHMMSKLFPNQNDCNSTFFFKSKEDNKNDITAWSFQLWDSFDIPSLC